MIGFHIQILSCCKEKCSKNADSIFSFPFLHTQINQYNGGSYIQATKKSRILFGSPRSFFRETDVGK